MWLILLFAVALGAEVLEGRATVVDGDSLVIDGVDVRLHGLDAPEWDQPCFRSDGAPYPCGLYAAQALSGLVRDRRVRCRQLEIDRYGRVVARCLVGRHDVARLLVRAGAAVAYTRYSDDYTAEEALARGRLRGIWQGHAETPEHWRRLSDGERAAIGPAAPRAPPR